MPIRETAEHNAPLKNSPQDTASQETDGSKSDHQSGSLLADSANIPDDTPPIKEAEHVKDRPTKRKRGSIYPDWRVWKKRPNLKLWEAVALSKNINPEKLEVVRKENKSLYKGFPSRLKTAIYNLTLLLVF